MNQIINFYEQYDEDSRITTDQARRIEFKVTTSVLNDYLKEPVRILELGAGTGAYSFYYAKRGHEVVATDLTPKHVSLMKEKMEYNPDLNIEAYEVNALDLSQFEDASFDVVLCLGPMYHLIEEADRKQCLNECHRVLKKDGLFAIAYINKHFIIQSLASNNPTYIKKGSLSQVLNKGFIKAGEETCFWTDAYFTTPSEMETLLNPLFKVIDHAGVDGLSPFMRQKINQFEEETYQMWVDYQLSTCREESIFGMSNHGLIISRK